METCMETFGNMLPRNIMETFGNMKLIKLLFLYIKEDVSIYVSTMIPKMFPTPPYGGWKHGNILTLKTLMDLDESFFYLVRTEVPAR